MFWNRTKTIHELLNEHKKIKVLGSIFHIKKVNPLDFADSRETMQNTFDIRTVDGRKPPLTEDLTKQQRKAIRMHYRDVILSCIVKPKISVKEEEGSVCVDEILNNWELTTELYLEIMSYSYGKKKAMFQA